MVKKTVSYVAVILFSLVFFTVLVLPSLLPNDLFHFIKVSNKGYSKNVSIYLVSWYGCPFGASLSWPLYDVLSHFGNVSAETHYSIYESDIGGYVPGLLFLDFIPNSTVSFHYVYLYNEYLNASPEGTPMKNLVEGGIEELRNEAPTWVYQLILEYDINDSDIFTGLSMVSPAYMGNPPHIPTTLIITGPNGTWILIGYLNSLNPSSLAVSSEGHINKNYILSLTSVKESASTIMSVINSVQ